MKRKRITIDPAQFPAAFRPLLEGATVFDSSCSPTAKVYFIHRDGGYYLKSAPAGSLAQEAALTRFFHSKGLAAEVLAYESSLCDWMLTRRIPGEDCTARIYQEDPPRLSEALGQILRALHDTDCTGFPLPDRTAEYLADAAGREAAAPLASLLRSDTLIHGDYCLPNIMLDNWRFSGFIDLGGSGLGDRHIDLYWGAWSLAYNLKTDRYRSRFLDAYGRDRADAQILELIAAAESHP